MQAYMEIVVTHACPYRYIARLQIAWEELKSLLYMTKGAMCQIFTAEYKGHKVVVKVPRIDCEDPSVAEHDLEVELDVLKNLDHK